MPREYDDDRPRRDDDYEDRPKRRRRDDDDDYAPAAKKGGSSVALIIGGVLLLFLCLGGGFVALLYPAMSKVRGAAARANDANNLKQLAIAMHSDESATGSWTAPFVHDENGKVHQGLSWRVNMLPYIEQPVLFQSIDLTQPWNSPRNSSHTSIIVKTFNTPYDDAPSANTSYRVLVGGGALFEPDGKPIKFTDIRDGSSNTILIVQSLEQVPWAQPKEIAYSATGPIPQLGHKNNSTGANVVLADGSVRFISKDTSEQVLRALITKAGNETIPLDW